MASKNKNIAAYSPGLLAAYAEAVNNLIVYRVRLTLPVGAALYLLFNYVDYKIYPQWTAVFLKIRIAVVLILALITALSFVKKISKNFILFAQASIFVMAAGIVMMIWLADGASSHYYEGINLTFWGLLCVNSFSMRHNAWTGVLVLALYEAAALANPAGWNFQSFLLANCFMGSTLILACLMNQFYSAQHFRGFVVNEELKQSEKKLEETNAKLAELYREADQLSKVDELTRIFNRRHFINILESKLRSAKQTDTLFYLVIFDIDHFKNVNDTYGHPAGDKVICEVARAVQDQLRAKSFMGRYGGDEFVFIIDRAERPNFLSRIETISQAVKNLLIDAGDHKIRVSASFGAVKVEPKKFDDVEHIIDAADKALLNVKKSGRGGTFLID